MNNLSLGTGSAPDLCLTEDCDCSFDGMNADVPALSEPDLYVMLNHEFRTSMNVIMGFAQIMGLKNVNQDEIKSYAKTILMESEQLLFLFNELISKQFLKT